MLDQRGMWKHCDSALRWKGGRCTFVRLFCFSLVLDWWSGKVGFAGPYCLPPWPTRDRNQAEGSSSALFFRFQIVFDCSLPCPKYADRSRLQKIKMTGQGSAPRPGFCNESIRFFALHEKFLSAFSSGENSRRCW